MKHLLLLSFAVTALVACAKTESPILQTPPEKVAPITLTAGKVASIPDPKVNILFVVDNSGSMKVHQETLKRNISKFADTFFQNPRIDYRIGIVPVYDRTYQDGQAHCRLAGAVRSMNPFAELVPLKNPDDTLVGGAPFITRNTPNGADILKSTVAIGVKCGPEAEESLSPVLGIIDPIRNIEKNGGFYDKDAYLVVIFLTDADDVTMDYNRFYETMLAEKGGDKSKLLFAAALPESRGCAVDSRSTEIRKLINKSGGSRFDLCSSKFGEQLVKFGNKLVKRVAEQEIFLGFIPDTRLSLAYGTKEMRPEELQPIPRGVDGYLIKNGPKPNTRLLVIQSNLNIQRVEGGEIFITAYPIDPNYFGNGRAHEVD
jgi:hypothetical protein